MTITLFQLGLRKRRKIIYTTQLILEFLETIQCHVYGFVIKLFIAMQRQNKNKLMTELTLHLLQYHI